MKLFRIYLVVVFSCLTVYTLFIGNNHGWNLLPIFFSDIACMTWSGQFNFDFMTFLGLSGIWVAWRLICFGQACRQKMMPKFFLWVKRGLQEVGKINLLRWVTIRTIKETFEPPVDFKYPHMAEE